MKENLIILVFSHPICKGETQQTPSFLFILWKGVWTRSIRRIHHQASTLLCERTVARHVSWYVVVLYLKCTTQLQLKRTPVSLQVTFVRTIKWSIEKYIDKYNIWNPYVACVNFSVILKGTQPKIQLITGKKKESPRMSQIFGSQSLLASWTWINEDKAFQHQPVTTPLVPRAPSSHKPEAVHHFKQCIFVCKKNNQ